MRQIFCHALYLSIQLSLQLQQPHSVTKQIVVGKATTTAKVAVIQDHHLLHDKSGRPEDAMSRVSSLNDSADPFDHATSIVEACLLYTNVYCRQKSMVNPRLT